MPGQCQPQRRIPNTAQSPLPIRGIADRASAVDLLWHNTLGAKPAGMGSPGGPLFPHSPTHNDARSWQPTRPRVGPRRRCGELTLRCSDYLFPWHHPTSMVARPASMFASPRSRRRYTNIGCPRDRALSISRSAIPRWFRSIASTVQSATSPHTWK
jgi:hypothetical protein